MGTQYKNLDEVELLRLYRTNKDLTAYKILLERYQKYSRSLAGEIVNSFRPKFYPDYNELVQIGVFSFDIAVRNFDFEKTKLKAYWYKIAKNEMLKEAYDQRTQFKFISHIQISEERTRESGTGIGFSSGGDINESLLLDDIIAFLENPINNIKPNDGKMFLDYLEIPDYHVLAERYGICKKTAKRRIDHIRQLIITNILEEDI